ncbi:HNH endonuclease [Peribacillus frigoritolerans]|uniref:HNH endonuclease n=1 Tax=Peribacillus frigoritolerans TaxID=450367 RepID=UPI003D2AC795
MGKRLTIEEVKQACETAGITYIGGFVGARDPFNAICKCGEPYKPVINSVRKGSYCRKCNGRSMSEKYRLPIQEVKRRCEIAGITYVEGFETIHKPFIAICRCGEIFYPYLPDPNKPRKDDHKCRKCTMTKLIDSKRLTEEDAKKICEAAGVVYVGGWVDTHTPIKAICGCGKPFTPLIQRSWKGTCKDCAMKTLFDSRRIPLDEVIRVVEAAGMKYIAEYTVTRKPFTALCVCKREWTTAYFYNIRDGGKCMKCQAEYLKEKFTTEDRRLRARRHSIDNVKKEFNEKGFKLLDTEYVNMRHRMNFICICGEEDYMTYDSFKNGSAGCGKCSLKKLVESNTTSIEDIRRFLEIKGCELISTSYNGKEEIKFRCRCGNSYSRVWRRLKKTQQCRKCSLQNRVEKQKLLVGKLSPNYKHHISDEERIIKRAYYGYKQWRKQVYKRDQYTCVICEVTGGNLNAHHLYSHSTHPEKRLDLDNGVTLCVECHKDFHKKYTNFNNTKEQFEEYKIKVGF